MRNKAKAVIRLSRPFTLLAPAAGGLLFSYLGYLDNPGNPIKIILTPLILVLANYTSNVINQIYDREIDKINKPYRPIPAGEITVDEANSLAIILTLTTLTLAYTLINKLFGILLTIILLFAWIYSAPPLRLRARLFWGNLAIATPRGGLGIITAYSSYANPLNNTSLLIFALGMAIYVFGANTFKDFPDEKGDKICGVRNFVTVYGREYAMRIAQIITIISYLVFIRVIDILIMLPSIALLVAMQYYAEKNPELKTKTENTIMWTLFYINMAALFTSYLLTVILQ
ncbi:MAG: UbiA family prenyltransferase [Deltaproteobacteria bacterium]|nr:UbiA family prenyltransferase [Deltaproteobacteria bacterium]